VSENIDGRSGVRDVSSLQGLAGADLATVLEALGAEEVERAPVTGYEGLSDVELVEAPGGERIFVRGDEVKMIYLGEECLPPSITHDALIEALGADTVRLRSSQGKSARQHVVAEQGIAWSVEGDEVGFVEVFPPTDMETYRREVYVELTYKL
jgi:hypothetical protein